MCVYVPINHIMDDFFSIELTFDILILDFLKKPYDLYSFIEIGQHFNHERTRYDIALLILAHNGPFDPNDFALRCI